MSDMFHTSTLRIAGRTGQHRKSSPHLNEYMKHRDPVFDTDFKGPCVLFVTENGAIKICHFLLYYRYFVFSFCST